MVWSGFIQTKISESSGIYGFGAAIMCAAELALTDQLKAMTLNVGPGFDIADSSQFLGDFSRDRSSTQTLIYEPGGTWAEGLHTLI